MICKAKYSSKAEVEASGVSIDEFELKNGEYYLKESAIEDGELVFAGGAVSNKDRAVRQLKTAKEKIEDLEGQISELDSKLKATGAGDGTVLSKEETKQYNEYKALGAIKDIKKAVDEYPKLQEKIKNIEDTDGLSQFAKDSGLNLDVLKDWKFDATKGQGIEFFTKDDIQKVKGVDTKVKVPMVKVEEKEAGTDKVLVKEYPLMEIAQKRLSAYQVTALGMPVVQAAVSTTSNSNDTANSGVYIPNLGSSNSNTGGEKKEERLVDKYNAERASKPSAFDIPAPAKTS